jgi:uncharacterized protein (TIGR02466 family)
MSACFVANGWNNTMQRFVKKSYFPTLVFQIDVEKAPELNQKLLAAVYAERDRDRGGIQRSNYQELGGWHSHNDLHKSPQYVELVAEISKATDQMGKELGYDKRYCMKIGTMWSIINPPGSANRSHVHPGCMWSGVYYIQAPSGAGDIEFTDPRTAHLMNQARFQPNSKRPKDCWIKVRFTPTAGRMLIFPAWLYHGVDPNLSKELGDASNRVIISFNLNQQKR